jgi:hypothetical protein
LFLLGGGTRWFIYIQLILLELELELDVITRKLPVIRDEPPERPGAGLFF